MKMGQVDKGYTNRTLYVNLSDNKVESRPVTENMKNIFIGGRGFGLRLLWNGVKDETKWNDRKRDSHLCRAYSWHYHLPGSGKSLVVTLSPLTNVPVDSNVGGLLRPAPQVCRVGCHRSAGKGEL